MKQRIHKSTKDSTAQAVGVSEISLCKLASESPSDTNAATVTLYRECFHQEKPLHRDVFVQSRIPDRKLDDQSSS